MKTLIAADIGGTHSRFGIFHDTGDGRLSLDKVVWLNTAEYGSFGGLIEGLRKSDFPLAPEEADIVVIAIAGPVEMGTKSSPPFISWGIDIANAGEDFGFKRAALINDFVAQAFSCLSPAGESAELVVTGEAVKGAATAVIGAGTGLGKAVILPDEKAGHRALPSEGGHSNFPFVSGRECEFQEFLLRTSGERYITANDVVSGRGLSSLHLFLTGEKLEPRKVAEKFRQNPRTLEWASRFYGRVCRNYALETLALGGLYIAGGVAARNPELVKGPVFEAEFRSSDTMSALLARIPVYLITDENSGLWGGAVYGLQALTTAWKNAGGGV
jgi:glucokinase